MLRKIMHSLRKCLLVSCADVFSSKFMFTCSTFYAQWLFNEFMPWRLDTSINQNDDDHTSEATAEASGSIIQHHQRFWKGK